MSAAPLADNTGPVCTGQPLVLTVAAVDDATYLWSGPNGFSSSLQTPVIASAGATHDGTYSVTATVSGCTSPAGTTTATVRTESEPSEATDLRLAGSGTTTFTWNPPADPGGGTVTYDLLRSTSAADFLQAVCVASGQSGTSTTDASVPAPLLFYLVRAKNSCGGTLGTTSDGTPRSGAICP
jgi:hypothetical protein